MTIKKFHDAQIGLIVDASVDAGLDNFRPVEYHYGPTGIYLAIFSSSDLAKIDRQLAPVKYIEFKEQVARILGILEDDLGIAMVDGSTRIVFYDTTVVQSVKISPRNDRGDTKVQWTIKGAPKKLKPQRIDLGADLRETPRFPSEIFELARGD